MTEVKVYETKIKKIPYVEEIRQKLFCEDDLLIDYVIKYKSESIPHLLTFLHLKKVPQQGEYIRYYGKEYQILKIVYSKETVEVHINKISENSAGVDREKQLEVEKEFYQKQFELEKKSREMRSRHIEVLQGQMRRQEERMKDEKDNTAKIKSRFWYKIGNKLRLI